MRRWEKELGKKAIPEVAIPQKRKQFGREFLSLDIIFDALFLTSSVDARHRLRVPMSTLVDYKGFRAIVIPSIPV